MWRSYRVPKTGQIIKKSSTYQMVMANSVALSSRVWMNPFSLKMLATRHTRDGFDILNPKTGQRTKADLDTLGWTHFWHDEIFVRLRLLLQWCYRLFAPIGDAS